MDKLTVAVYCKSGSFALVTKNNDQICHARIWEDANTISAYNVADIYMHFFETGDFLDTMYLYCDDYTGTDDVEIENRFEKYGIAFSDYCDDYDGNEAIEIADRFKHYGIAFSDKPDEDCTDSLGLICSLREEEQQIAVPFMQRCMEHARNM